jgi:hypothetical protein
LLHYIAGSTSRLVGVFAKITFPLDYNLQHPQVVAPLPRNLWFLNAKPGYIAETTLHIVAHAQWASMRQSETI